MTRRVHDLLLWFSAADLDRLDRCPREEERRFLTAGGMVLATTGMAFLAGTFSFNRLVHVPLLFAVVLGAAFALMIMNLERYVQTSLRRQSHWALTVLSAVPRIALSYFMGLVITIPLMLAVFASDVEKQITRDRNAALTKAGEGLDREFAEIPRLTHERNALQLQLNTVNPGIVLKQSPEYVALARRIDRLQNWVRTTTDPKLVRSYQRQINRLGPEIRTLRGQLLTQESAASASAHAEQQARIDDITPRLRHLTRLKAMKEAELETRYGGSAGFAAHVTALEHVADNEAGVGTVKKVLVIFLVLVDCMPALLTTSSLIGRKFPYETDQDAEERSAAASAAVHEQQRCRAEAEQLQAHFDAQRELALERLKAQVDAQREVDRIYIETLREKLRAATGQLARDAAADYLRDVGRPRSTPPGNGPRPQRGDVPARPPRSALPRLRAAVVRLVERVTSRRAPAGPGPA